MPIREKDVAPFLPENCAADICNLLNGHGILLHIKKHRYSKSGDFTVDGKTGKRKISVNGTLNKYAFLITLVHEIAHLYVWEKFRPVVRPHGKEWKETFIELMRPFMQKNIFPPDIERALARYLSNPGASTSGNKRLALTLLNYSGCNETRLEQLPDGARFKLHNGMVMKKLTIMRTRYKCLCINNNKIYSVSPLTEVIPLDNNCDN